MKKPPQLSVDWAKLVFKQLEQEDLDASALFKHFPLAL